MIARFPPLNAGPMITVQSAPTSELLKATDGNEMDSLNHQEKFIISTLKNEIFLEVAAKSHNTSDTTSIPPHLIGDHQSFQTSEEVDQRNEQNQRDSSGQEKVKTTKLWTFPIVRFVYNNLFPTSNQTVTIINNSDSELIACICGDRDAMIIKKVSGKLTISGGQFRVGNVKRNKKQSKQFTIIGKFAYYSIYMRRLCGTYSVIRENVLIKGGELWEAFADGSNTTELKVKVIDHL